MTEYLFSIPKRREMKGTQNVCVKHNIAFVFWSINLKRKTSVTSHAYLTVINTNLFETKKIVLRPLEFRYKQI